MTTLKILHTHERSKIQGNWKYEATLDLIVHGLTTESIQEGDSHASGPCFQICGLMFSNCDALEDY